MSVGPGDNIENLAFFATVPRGGAGLLADELRSLGATEVRENPGGVHFTGTLASAYRACLWSRTANRILLPLAAFPVPHTDALYEAVTAITWEDHLDPDGTLAVDVVGNTPELTHSQYAAQRVKDAVVDRFRTRVGRRPSVDREQPNLQLNLHLHAGHATLALDLSGASLHRRGYRRTGGGIAPLKENLAAAILLRAGWPSIAAAGGALVDPLCGSGTFLIEAALMAGDGAPGWRRDYWGFSGWLGHIPALWSSLHAEAEERRAAGLARLPPIIGYDADPQVIRIALDVVEQAGLHGYIHIERRELAAVIGVHTTAPGLVVVNPPYGARLGEPTELIGLYAHLGEIWRAQFSGWEAALLTDNLELARRLGQRAWRMHPLDNGPIACHLLRFHLTPEWRMAARPTKHAPVMVPTEAMAPGALMFANRLRKNLKELTLWATAAGINCYRLYDADMPEYAVAIDLYQGKQRWVHCQEYAAPATVDPEQAALRLAQVMAVIPTVLEVPAEHIFLKVRQRQKHHGQYQRQGVDGRFHEVSEGEYTFLVNFTDHLDTGLFLDQRPTRALLGQWARGRRFLNLYAYTAAATVYAAAGGAIATTSVDLSATYQAWARRNLARNGFFIAPDPAIKSAPRHEFISADVFPWLLDMASQRQRRYGLIFLDPPTFSRSKRMTGVLDIQRDHLALLIAAARLLDPEGVILFSTHYRRFRLDQAGLINAGLMAENITAQTIPHDFARNPHIHQCWRICAAQ